MKLHLTALGGVVVAEFSPSIDHRGAFSRLYCEQELSTIIGHRRIVQINHSCTHSVGAVRGMHYQRHPRGEMKLIRCLKGRVWDVAVDLRKGSPTFLQWHAAILTPQNARTLVIPEGCAHGFQVLDPDSELLYLHTEFYSPEHEGAVSCKDTRISIAWPLPIVDLSVRDNALLPIAPDFTGITV
jgi:dTDP-4-dehydrorhamnose 3,5-epimerase